MTGEPDNFGPAWAANKLDMPRRRIDLEKYIADWLPELRTMKPGLVLDIGCGPGDFLALCRDMGHEVIGIDAPSGAGGMGDSYLSACRVLRTEFGVPVLTCGAKHFLKHGLAWSDGQPLLEQHHVAACCNLRGSIEQCLSHVMLGQPHDLHHDCRQLNWDTKQAQEELAALLDRCSQLLRPGGILMIAANGTKSTNQWYDDVVCQLAALSGMYLVQKSGLLFHKWVRE